MSPALAVVPDTPTTRLGRSQAARRRRVIDATVELGSAGGYDAIQMRDVAAAAGVALGTIYRYFASKDHLLAEVMVEAQREIQRSLEAVPARGATPAERLDDIFQRRSSLELRPKMMAAIMRAMASSDPDVRTAGREIGQIRQTFLARALWDLDPDQRAGVIRVLGHIWYSSLVGMVNEWEGVTSVRAELRTAARLLLPAPDPTSSPPTPPPPPSATPPTPPASGRSRSSRRPG
jgi:TetR/AcrR family transcriptional regulator, cholesterol catabolism regulator